MSAIFRNKELLKSVLAGASYSECVTQYRLNNISSVQAAVRSMLVMLKDHTDIDIEPTSSHAYVMQHKETLLRYLDKPLPKISITPAVKDYLIKKYGKYYATMAERVAQDWEEIKKVFTAYPHARERYSIQTWLASEGYFVGDFVSLKMLSCAHEAITQKLQTLDFAKEDMKFRITKMNTPTTTDNASLFFEAEFSFGQHVVERRFKVSML